MSQALFDELMKPLKAPPLTRTQKLERIAEAIVWFGADWQEAKDLVSAIQQSLESSREVPLDVMHGFDDIRQILHEAETIDMDPDPYEGA